MILQATHEYQGSIQLLVVLLGEFLVVFRVCGLVVVLVELSLVVLLGRRYILFPVARELEHRNFWEN